MEECDYMTPISTVDICIFTVMNKKLMVLTHKRLKAPYRSQSSLPGGFIFADQDYDIDATAIRVLRAKTGVKVPYLEQVQTVGSLDRDPRGWSITTLYFSLVDASKINIKEGEWVEIENVGSLAFDHNKLLNIALRRLQKKSSYTAIPLSLLPSMFTLTQAQEMFELILCHKQEKKSFRKRLLDNECAILTDKTVISGKRKAALYMINRSYDYEFPRSLNKNLLEL